MGKKLRLTTAQALIRFLAAQRTDVDGQELPLFAGVFAIFGHGNVAGLGEALEEMGERLPVFRAHSEQGMAHAAVAFAKASQRRRMMACTTSVGPGATNLVTAAATAHVNRLPVLLLPGDTFANRRPDPVLQQLEDFGDPTCTVNDCLRPVSRYWDRISRPEQLLASLPRALQVLTDPAECGPVTLALPQDVQTEAFAFPPTFFIPTVHRARRPRPDLTELGRAVATLAQAERPLIIAGGGVHYAEATEALARFAEAHGVPVAETQAGKGALPWSHRLNVGSIGVTGSAAANALAEVADVVLAVGTRLSDFTTASRSLFRDPAFEIVGLNVAGFDAGKHGSRALQCDAREGLTELGARLEGWAAPAAWTERSRELRAAWDGTIDAVTAAPAAGLPTDAQVLGAVNRSAQPADIVVCAAGGLPGELHKLWRCPAVGGYHLEYGYSCMGYEIAGGMGVRMARPGGEVLVLVGDGSYMMMNSELATAVASKRKLIVVLLDNHGFGCISRLQQSCGGQPYNNLLVGADGAAPPAIDFAAHAAALGASAERVVNIAELEAAIARARGVHNSTVITIATDPAHMTEAGGAWWDVAVAEVSDSEAVQQARSDYEVARLQQRVGVI